MNRPPLTRSGAERLRAELAQLKQKVRPEITAAIAEARAHGDLKENAEYHAAREQQAFVEGRIQRLETTLSSAQVIDVGKLTPNGRVVFGVTVTVADEETGEETSYQIVGDLESDLKENRIGVSSPIARALIGKDEGEVVSLSTPGGVRDLEIITVEYL